MTAIFGYKRKTIKIFPSKAILIIGLFLIFNEKKILSIIKVSYKNVFSLFYINIYYVMSSKFYGTS